MYDEDPGKVIGKAMPDTPPPARFDLDRIVRDGYHARRRHRAMLGGAATTSVMAVTAVIAMAVHLSPGDASGGLDAAEREQVAPAPTESAVEDPSVAGYPYSEAWENREPRTAEGREVEAALTEAFEPVLTEGGLWGTEEHPEELYLTARQRPGNYGQTWLRGYRAERVEEVGGLMGYLREVFQVEVMPPGGWTAEPGPVTEQLFPQHLISDGPHYTDTAPEFTSTALDDGRTLMVADHGCAYDLAVTYPNGTGLRVGWDADCEGTAYPVSLEALTEAVLAVPEFDLDTTELAPVGELLDVPTGWVHDPQEAWERSEETWSMTEETYAMAAEAIQDLHPGSTLGSGTPAAFGGGGRGETVLHSYLASGTLPFQYEDHLDGVTRDLPFELRYYLPGGWVPGYSEIGGHGPYLTHCDAGADCNMWDDGDGSTWVFTERTESREAFTEDSPGMPYTEHELEGVYFSPDGWAVGVWAGWHGDLSIDADVLGDILRSVPAPFYDEDDVPQIPAG